MLEEIRSDIASLLALYESEKKRAESLGQDLAECRTALEDSKKQITELNREIDNLKLMAAFSPETNRQAAKERVDALIKEIDKCIKLLER